MLNGRVACAVLVSGGGTNLQALIDEAARGRLPSLSLSLVVASKPDAYALQRAAAAGIPTAVVARRDYASQQAFEAALSAVLEKANIKMLVLAGYLTILSGAFTASWPRRMLNVHPSLIPAFCGQGFYGLRVHEAALRRGVKVSGATVHYVNEIPDGGEIVLQKAVAVLDGDTPQTLQRRIMEQAEWELLPRAAELTAARILQEEKKGL